MNTNELKFTIGERLVQLREKFGLSQAQVASTIGVDRTSYAKYEKNVNKPTRKLKELSELFHVTTDYIMCLSEHPYGAPFAGQDNENFLVFDYQIFAIRLKNLCQKNNISQEELEKISGVSLQVIEDWESSKRTPDAPTLSQLANYFNVSVDYLLGRTDEPQGTGFQKGDGGNEGNTVEETDDAAGGSTILMRAQSELSPEELAQIEHMAKFFLDQKAAKNDK